MRTYSSDVFELIKTMSRSEKGYFKKYTSLHGGENDYVKLFDFIEKQKEYDERKIKKKFEGEAFVKRFAPVKHYLFNTLLESMYAFHLKSSDRAVLLNRYVMCDILMKKGLYAIAHKEVLKLKKKSEEGENYLLLLQCLIMQRTLFPYINKHEKDKLSISLESLIDEEKKTMKLLDMFYKVYHFSSTLFDYLRKSGPPKDEKEMRGFKNHIHNVTPDLDFDESQMTDKIKQQYYHSMALYLHFLYKEEEALVLRQKLIELLEKLPRNIFLQQAVNYAGAIGNLVISAKILKRYRLMEKYLEEGGRKIATLKNPLREQAEWKMFSTTAVVKLNYFLQNAMFEKCDEYIGDCEKQLERYKSYNDYMGELLVYYFAGYYNFIVGNYKKTLHYFRIIASQSKYKNLNADIDSYIRIIEIIAQVKLNNHELAESRVNAAAYQIKKNKFSSKTEMAIITFFRSELQHMKPSFSKKALLVLQKKIKLLLKNKTEQIILEHFDVLAWISAELRGVPTSVVIKENAS